MLFAIEHLSRRLRLSRPALPAGDERAAIFGLDHAVVRTANAEAAKALYGDRLGLRLALDRTFPQWGARLLFFRVGGITLEVAAALAGDREEMRAALRAASARFAETPFAADFDAVIRAIDQRGRFPRLREE